MTDKTDKNKKAGNKNPAFFNGPDFNIEKDLFSKGSLIAGVDEAGRGCLAGPLAVGLVMYTEDFIQNPSREILQSVRDSKKMTPLQREKASGIIKRHALYAQVFMVSPHIIDKININCATELALIRLIEGISFNRPELRPDMVILDGVFSFRVPVPCISIKKGDNRSISIASAGILAKVTRDGIMDRFDSIYPQYGFIKNKGYGTAYHRTVIEKEGYCPIHRKSYEPVRSMIIKESG